MLQNIRFFLLCALLIGTTMVSYAEAPNSETDTHKHPLTLKYKEMTFSIGGFMRTEALYDFGGYLPDNLFIPANISMKPTWNEMSRFHMTAFASRLNFNFDYNSPTIGKVSSTIEGDFFANGNTFRLRHAYFKACNFTIGQTWSAFYDGAAHPYTTDMQGPNGRTFMRTPLIHYTYSPLPNLSFITGIEFSMIRLCTDSIARFKPALVQMPNIPLIVNYSYRNGHIRLGGIYRRMSYDDLSSQKRYHRNGWGVTLSGSQKIGPLTIQYQGIYGKGIAFLLSDQVTQSIDLAQQKNHPSDMDALPMGGIYCSLNYQFLPKWKIVCTPAYAFVKTPTKIIDKQNYAASTSIEAMIEYRLTPNVALMGAYIYGNRIDRADNIGKVNRLQLAAIYFF